MDTEEPIDTSETVAMLDGAAACYRVPRSGLLRRLLPRLPILIVFVNFSILILFLLVPAKSKTDSPYEPDHGSFDAAQLAWARARAWNGSQKTGDGGRDLLTIIIDLKRNDDKSSATLHVILPSWLRWRYVIVDDDDYDALQIDTAALVVSRWIWPPSPLIDWAIRHPYPLGLLLMADETGEQDSAAYAAFDFVLRHYYFKTPPMQALGNLTCGTTAQPAALSQLGPRLGIHWTLLQARGLGLLDSGHRPGSHWPASRRPVPVVWIGSLRADRAAMVDVMRSAFPEGDLQVEPYFHGNVGPLQYSFVRTARAVFALDPAGFNPQTHRFAESLDQGCIPVFLDGDAFRHATFEPVPGVVARSWTEAADRMKELLDGDPARLDALQDKCVAWWHRWKQCAAGDLELLLKRSWEL